MSGRDDPPAHPPTGEVPPASGQDPTTVETSLDAQSRRAIALVLLGPLVWAAHFVLVYLVSEAGCTGEGPGLRIFDPPVPTLVTLGATAVAAVGCLAVAGWAFRRWRAGRVHPMADEAGDPSVDLDVREFGGSLAFIGLLLSLVSLLSVLMVGLPALVLPPC